MSCGSKNQLRLLKASDLSHARQQEFSALRLQLQSSSILKKNEKAWEKKSFPEKLRSSLDASTIYCSVPPLCRQIEKNNPGYEHEDKEIAKKCKVQFHF